MTWRMAIMTNLIRQPSMSLPVRFSRITKLGILLAIASVLPWLLLLVLPFLPCSLAERAILAAGLLVLAEVMFWVGAALAGHEVVRRFRQKLNPKNYGKLWSIASNEFWEAIVKELGEWVSMKKKAIVLIVFLYYQYDRAINSNGSRWNDHHPKTQWGWHLGRLPRTAKQTYHRHSRLIELNLEADRPGSNIVPTYPATQPVD